MKTFAKAPLALAISALLVAPYALATGSDNDFDTDAYLDVDVENDIRVEIEHEVTNDIWVEIDMEMDADPADHFAAATIDRKQFNDDNIVKTEKSDNDAAVNGSAGTGASGNIGINVAAGDLNKQANDTAIAKGSTGLAPEDDTRSASFCGPWGCGGGGEEEQDASMVFAKAATFSVQSSSNNSYYNDGTENSAELGGSALTRASGNIGVNIAAGAGNDQHNGMALAVGQDSSAEATTGGVQVSYGNVSDNDLYEASVGPFTVYVQNNENDASLGGSALTGANGNIGVNIASGNGNMQSNTLSIARAQ